jgi:hypothetical protein
MTNFSPIHNPGSCERFYMLMSGPLNLGEKKKKKKKKTTSTRSERQI